MGINPESFAGRFYLLVIDKIIIGAIVAGAIVLYDQYRTSETRNTKQSSSRPNWVASFCQQSSIRT